MKFSKLFFTLSLTVISVWCFAQNGFEGVITMNTTNEALNEKATISWYLKGDKTRMDISSQAGEHSTEYAIIADEKGMDMVSEGHVTSIPQVSMKMDNSNQTMVSKTDGINVNGFDCQKVIYTDGTHETTYWFAEGTGLTFDDLPFVIKRNMPKVTSSGFPVKMEKKDATGKLILSQEVLSITAAAVELDRFERK